MKKLLLLLALTTLFTQLSISQVIYSSKIDSLINLISLPLMMKIDRELSGDTITNVNGLPYKIFSRFYTSPGNPQAAQYIKEKLVSYGLPARFQSNNSRNVNVIARKTGYRNPNRVIVISGHYDNIITTGSLPSDTIPGADDNATGVIAMLEAARLLSNYNMPYTVEFVAFDEEEIGYLGAIGYADSVLYSQDTLMGVINMDMIGWDGNNDGLIRIMTTTYSDFLADILINCYARYNIALTPFKHYNAAGSDHIPFWQRGFMAISSIEPSNDFNPYYHSHGDLFTRINQQYFLKNTKANIAALLSIADEKIYFIHYFPITSGIDTSAKILETYIEYPIPLGTGPNSPKLYYKVNNGNYQSTSAFLVQDKVHYFRIPGMQPGSKISYYVAAQDFSGNYVTTYPAGGSGANPPGSNPPPTVFDYYVWSTGSFSSINNKLIQDNSYTYDTINISNQGLLGDIELNVNLNHTNDGDVLITLYKSTESAHLTQFNGEGGQNYTNTTFDDSASVSITNGTPPFTGRFKPQINLTSFIGKQIQGKWILRIYDKRAGNTGTLLNWTLLLKWENQVAIKKDENVSPQEYKLYQNYPNPFNPVTNISFELPKSGTAKLLVYDVLGKLVKTLADGFFTPGKYDLQLDASDLKSGIYFYQLTSGDFSTVKKLILIK